MSQPKHATIDSDLGSSVLAASLSPKNRLAVLALPLFGLGLLVLIAVPVLLQAFLRGGLAVGLVILLGVGVAGAGVAVWLVYLVRMLDLRHEVFDRGWVWTSRGRTRTVRFADVTGFDDASFHLRAHGVVPNAILRLQGGEAVDVFRHGGFPGHALFPGWAPGLVATLGRQVALARVAEAMRTHLAGRPLPFGDVVLEADGSVRVGNDRAGAEELGLFEIVSVYRSRVLRIPRGGGAPLEVPLSAVPDYPLLLSVGNYLVNQRRRKPEAPVSAERRSVGYLPIPREGAASAFDPDGGTLVILVHYNPERDAPVQHAALTRPFTYADLPQVWLEIDRAWGHSQATFELLERQVIRTNGTLRRLSPAGSVQAADLGTGCAYPTNDAPRTVESEYLLLEHAGDTHLRVLPDGRLPRFHTPETLDAALRAEGTGLRLGARVVATLYWHMHM